jgi:hypothetical protein
VRSGDKDGMIARHAICLLLLILGACGAEAPSAKSPEGDTVMRAALQAPLLVDPDLSQQNARNLVIVPPGPMTAPQPLASQPPP